jgi:hypothetical protein
MIVRCVCGSVFWGEPPSSCCPSCDEPALLRSPGESTERFGERCAMYVQTRADIAALPEPEPVSPPRALLPRLRRVALALASRTGALSRPG